MRCSWISVNSGALLHWAQLALQLAVVGFLAAHHAILRRGCVLSESTLWWASLPPFLFSVSFNMRTNIRNLLLYHTSKKGTQLLQFSICWINEPCEYLYSILRLSLEIVFDVVNYDGLLQITAKHWEIFHVHSVIILAMLPIESMRYVVAAFIYIVQNEISIVLSCCCEYHDFIIQIKWTPGFWCASRICSGNIFEELQAAWTELEFLLFRLKVNKRLIEVKDQSISIWIRFWWQKWWAWNCFRFTYRFNHSVSLLHFLDFNSFTRLSRSSWLRFLSFNWLFFLRY